MQETIGPRMPTGISSLDPVLDGGIPPGSLVLLFSDVGAGSQEYVYSTLMYLSALKRRAGAMRGSQVLPDRLSYITFTRLKEDVLSEIRLSFKEDMVAALPETIAFADLSQHYFDNSVVPSEWYSGGDIITRMQRKRPERGMILAELSGELTRVPKGSLIVLDSLTDLATQYQAQDAWNDLIAYLRGLQRIAKTWGTTIYLLLTRGVLEPSREAEIADCADAVLLFKWEENAAQRRQRTMYFEKFRGVMPHLEERDLVKFAVRISPASGFEVQNIRVVI